jgi:ribosome-binding factor A
MDPRRSERLSEAIREELDEMISYELSDPRIDTAGVAEVAVSPDARTARVRVLLTGDAKAQKQCLDALNSAKSYIRRELAQRIDLFRIPELHFEAAVSAELGSRLEHLLKRVRRGRPRGDETAPAHPGDSMQVAEDKLTSQKKPVQ